MKKRNRKKYVEKMNLFIPYHQLSFYSSLGHKVKVNFQNTNNRDLKISVTYFIIIFNSYRIKTDKLFFVPLFTTVLSLFILFFFILLRKRGGKGEKKVQKFQFVIHYLIGMFLKDCFDC